MTKINDMNQRKWTSATETFQQHSEDAQTARGTVQAAYDMAQGNGDVQRDSLALARIERDASMRQNKQQGVHIIPTVPTA